MKETRKRGFAITNNGISLIEQKMKEKGLGDIDLTFKAGLDKEGKAISRIRNGHRPERKTIQAIAKVLDISPTDLVDPQEWYSSSKNSTPSPSVVNWQSVSKVMLEDLKRLTTEALTAGDGIRFEFDNIFVPLGVVERQEKSKRKQEDGSPDRGSELYAEKVTPISHDVFFEDVLLRGNTKISQGKRIAVIGEAGAGKTTQLQKIGSWLLEETEYIPVWISLTALGAKSLREYLLEDWVRDAAEDLSAPQAWKDSLGEAIKSGKVWLLLDGVDEMTVSNPLSHLSSQLREGWLKDVRIVITCRVNVWDAGKNALTDFDVYRNLDFDYPNDVYQFIGNWFVSAPDLAEKLKQALEQSGKERIRDMVKNPLRLTLLCYSWKLRQGELPETKAGLYDWFVDAFYEWNKGKTKIELTRSKRDELNRELGELAKLAIDGEDSRFRLTETFIENAMNPDLFELALDLNWLNEVGVSAENSLEKVYAFYHPSFQEYFAALAIDDWDFFLPRDHVNKPVQGKRYRIFESNWNEVVLLWSGIYRNSNTKNKSTLFIEKLLAFEDGCAISNDYNYLGRLIALDIALESSNMNLFDNILDEIIEWAFGCLDQNTHEWMTYINEEEAILKLKGVSREILINKISKLLPDISSEDAILDVINFLWSINTNRSINIAIEYVLKSAIESNFREKLTGTIWHIQHHSKIIAGNSYLIKLFVGFVFSLDPHFRYIIFGSIQDSTLSKLMYSQDGNESVYLLEKIFINNPEKLITILKTFNWIEFRNESYLSSIENRLNSIDLKSLIEKCEEINNKPLKSEDYYFDFDEPEDELEEIICCKPLEPIVDYIQYLPIHKPYAHDTNEQSYNIILQILKREEIVDTHNPEAWMKIDYDGITPQELYELTVENLSKVVRSDDKDYDYYFCYLILINCAKNLSYKRFYFAWHLSKDFACNLESQFVDCDDVQKELDRTNDRPEETRCIVVDIRQLEQESDPNVIIQKIVNRIFDSLGLEIPIIQNIAVFETVIINLQRKLEAKKIAIALYCREENPTIGKLCHDLNPIQINLFTGEKTTEQLTARIQNWLSEM